MFQNYWFVFNLLLLAASCCKAKLDPSSSEIVTRNPLVYNICLVICISSGFTSFFLFHCQQRMLEIFEEKKIDHIGPIQWMGWSMIRENTEMSIQRKKTRQMKKLKEERYSSLILHWSILSGPKQWQRWYYLFCLTLIEHFQIFFHSRPIPGLYLNR